MKPRMVMLAALMMFVGLWSDAVAQTAASKAAPNSNIPTVSMANVARHGFYYAGGKYVGELGDDKESTMGGAMYVEVMVPKQIRSPYPVVFFHGAGQTGVDWLQTPAPARVHVSRELHPVPAGGGTPKADVGGVTAHDGRPLR